MKFLFVISLLIYSEAVWSATLYNKNFNSTKNSCGSYDECLKKFGDAILLANNVSMSVRNIFEKNWRLILDSKNILINERERVQGRSCSLANELVIAPKSSPLGKALNEKIKTFNELSPGSRDERFTFESDLTDLRSIANGNPVYGMIIGNYDSPLQAKKLLDEQKQWERANEKELAELSKKKSSEFKKECLNDHSQEIEKIRTKILKENRELSNLEDRLKKAQEECQGVHIFKDKAGERYGKNQTSNGRYNKMKEMAISLCSPADAIKNLLGNTQNDCAQYVQDIYDIISPECESRGGNEVKGNLCNGLHRHLVKNFIAEPKYDGYLRTLVAGMKNASDKKLKVDLLDMALESTKGDRVAAVRLIALLGHDEINTTMRAIREQLILSKQFDRLVAVDDLYTKEVHVFAAEDKRHEGHVIEGNMTLFKNLIRSGSTVGKTQLSGRYYHFIAGTVVACELREKKYGQFRAKTAASLAGKVYEAFDFKSHITDGVGFSKSIDNFRRDTAKHTAGGDLGSSFCP